MSCAPVIIDIKQYQNKLSNLSSFINGILQNPVLITPIVLSEWYKSVNNIAPKKAQQKATHW